MSDPAVKKGVPFHKPKAPSPTASSGRSQSPVLEGYAFGPEERSFSPSHPGSPAPSEPSSFSPSCPGPQGDTRREGRRYTGTPSAQMEVAVFPWWGRGATLLLSSPVAFSRAGWESAVVSERKVSRGGWSRPCERIPQHRWLPRRGRTFREWGRYLPGHLGHPGHPWHRHRSRAHGQLPGRGLGPVAPEGSLPPSTAPTSVAQVQNFPREVAGFPRGQPRPGVVAGGTSGYAVPDSISTHG